MPTTSWASHGTEDSSHITTPLLQAHVEEMSAAHLQQGKSLLLPSVTVLTHAEEACVRDINVTSTLQIDHG